MFRDLFITSIRIPGELPPNSYLNKLAIVKSLQAMEQMCKYLFSDGCPKHAIT